MKTFLLGYVAGMLSPVGMSAAGGDIEMERFISSLLEKMTLEESRTVEPVLRRFRYRAGQYADKPY